MMPRGVSGKTSRHRVADLFLVLGGGAERVDQHRNRLGHADGVRELQLAAVGQARGHDVFAA